MRYAIAVVLLAVGCSHSDVGPDAESQGCAGAICRPDAADTCPDASGTSCPLPALTHSCPALPCLAVFDCAAPDGLLRCKCELPVGTPHYIADCIGP